MRQKQSIEIESLQYGFMKPIDTSPRRNLNSNLSSEQNEEEEINEMKVERHDIDPIHIPAAILQREIPSAVVDLLVHVQPNPQSISRRDMTLPLATKMIKISKSSGFLEVMLICELLFPWFPVVNSYSKWPGASFILTRCSQPLNQREKHMLICHSGGGWALEEGETPLSHVPLVWIVREARKSGLQFDESKMKALHCWDESIEVGRDGLPTIELDGGRIRSSSSDEFSEKHGQFKKKLHHATSGKIHDCLMFDQGLPRMSVLNWKIMEWIPFRRMDLRDDGSWKPIRW